jgi:hypothetical protein
LRRAILTGVVCACAAIFGCESPSQNPSPQAKTESQQPAAPAVPPDIDAAARATLGSEGEALVWGDLAHNGRQQILVINRLNGPSLRSIPGAVLTRLAIVENDDGHWKEILVCDEHLKNTSGFLGGTPIAEVSSWRLQFVQDQKEGLELFLSPFRQGADIRTVAIEVRWNPEAHRYQAMDENHEHFMGETTELEPARRKLADQ